jgi:pimeloyl-ACP methyl ester carboxylesterase
MPTTVYPLAYDECGVGLPMVLLHGIPHDRTLWKPQLGAFVDACRCIAPDLRGFGNSLIEPPYTMDRYADDVVELLDTLGVDRAVVCGLSMGGPVAFAIWRRHRERVRALVLAGARAGVDTDEVRAVRRAQIDLVRSRGAAVLAAQVVTKQLGDRTRERHPDIVEVVRDMIARAPVEGIVGAQEAMIARPDSTPTLATIDVPTLVLVGDEDRLSPLAESQKIHAGIAGSLLETIAGAGHLSNIERPAAFNHVLSEFVARLRYA